MKKFICSLLIVMSGACVSALVAQEKQKIEAYRAGESLTYEAKFSRIIKGIAVADLDFTVERTADNRDYVIKSNAETKGSLLKLFNKKFIQNYESTVDGENFSIKRTVKHDEQGDRVRESEALFDYKEKKVIYVETDPNDAARAPRQIASPIKTDTQDLITGIYTIRRLPLVVGKTFELIISDSGLVYKVPVRVTAREQQKSILGKTWCFRIEPEVFGTNRLIEQKGSLTLWITDDARRLPVRAQVNSSIGRFEVKLKKMNDAPADEAKQKPVETR